MKKILWIILVLAALIIMYTAYHNRIFTDDELSVNGLVYLKKSGSLFSGTVEFGDSQHWGQHSYCKGEPCGHFLSKDYGDMTSEGVYLDKSTFSPEVQKIIGESLYAISLWSEGPYNSDAPEFLTVYILEPDWGTFNFKNYKHMDQIASSVARATLQSKYKFLSIRYVSDFSYHPSYWYSVDYRILNKKPVFDRRDSM